MAPLVVGGLFEIGSKLIDRLFPNQAEKDKATLELLQMQATGELEELKVRMSAVVAEAQSDSWLAANWRPITMLSFVFIIFNNWVLYPYFKAFGLPVIYLEVPVNVWNIVELGLGGYVIGRSGEKIASSVAEVLKNK
jgi:hypothetical protein